MDVGDVLGLPTDLPHDTLAARSLCATPSCEVHTTACRVSAPAGSLWRAPWQLLHLHNPTLILGPIVPQPCHRSTQLSVALLLLLIMFTLVLSVDPMPFPRV